MNQKKPRKPDPFKGMKKVIPIRPSEKKLSFQEKVEKFGEYMHDPEQHGKIFSELGFTYVDDVCEGDCVNCEIKSECTIYESIVDTHGQAHGTLGEDRLRLTGLRPDFLRFAPGRIHPRVNPWNSGARLEFDSFLEKNKARKKVVPLRKDE